MPSSLNSIDLLIRNAQMNRGFQRTNFTNELSNMSAKLLTASPPCNRSLTVYMDGSFLEPHKHTVEEDEEINFLVSSKGICKAVANPEPKVLVCLSI